MSCDAAIRECARVSSETDCSAIGEHLLDPVSTIHDAIRGHALSRPEAPAILAPGRQPVAYGALSKGIDGVVGALDALHVARGSRLAVLLPDGPDLALVLLGAMAGFAVLPLNTGFTPAEIEQSLRLARIDTLLVDARASRASGWCATAGVPGIRSIAVAPDGAGALHFDAPGLTASQPMPLGEADDLALLMQTSGTTGRPRLVPLRHRHLWASAGHVQDHFRLTPADRRLNVMPLVHIQGIVGGLIATLRSGGSIVCTDAFDPDRFLAWVAEFQPTWYSAVPTMHRSIVRRADGRPVQTSLRFIRNGSFPLTADEAAQIEAVFGVPVVESYGTTETASQIACNPLPPRIRKPGSAGIPAGPDVAVRRLDGTAAGVGERGDVWVRGPNVIDAYDGEGDDEVRRRFRDGWFCTGDVGSLDVDGYLFIHGRSRGHAAGRLAPFKVPRHVAIVDALRRGITGKALRSQVAALCTPLVPPASSSGAFVSPRTEVERILVDLWQELLGVRPSVTDDFFDLGGHSQLAARLLDRVSHRFGRELPFAALLPVASVQAVARFLESAVDPAFSPLVLLRDGAWTRPVFCVHPAGGSVALYANLARHLASAVRIYGIQAPGMAGNPEDELNVETLADRYTALVRSAQPQGAYRLLGHSLGGMISFEMARRLVAAGEAVALLVMIDSMCPTAPWERRHEQFMRRFMLALESADLRDEVDPSADRAMWAALCRLMGGNREDPTAGGDRDRHRRLFLDRLVAFGFLPAGDDLDDVVLRRFLRSLRAGYRAARTYRPTRLAQPMHYIRSGPLPTGCVDPAVGWSEFADGVRTFAIESNHFDLFAGDRLPILAAHLDGLIGALPE